MKALSTRFLFYGAVFTPVLKLLNDLFMSHAVLFFAVGVLVALDTVLGITIAAGKKKATSGTFWEKFFKKIISYTVLTMVCLIIFVLTQVEPHFAVDAETAEHIIVFPLAFMVIRELWSILENLDVLQPGLTTKLKQLLPEKFRNESPKP